MANFNFKCINCSSVFSEAKYTCPKCSHNLQIEFNLDKLKKTFSLKDLKLSKDFSIWRYSPLYPVNKSFHVPTVGWTPLYDISKLAEEFNVKNFYIKDESKNPSCSLKDRASAIFLAKALEDKLDVVCGASTGNAGSSTACLSAALGIKAIIFVPKRAPKPKLAQLQVFGAKLYRVDGNYDAAFDLCLEVCEKNNWFCRNTGFNPYTREGKKSVSFEICEQLNFEVPDFVFVPCGDGNILSGVWKGFYEFYKLGFINKLPRLVAVQAKKSNAIVSAFNEKRDIQKVSGDTIADSISVSLPRDGQAALKALEDSNGIGIEVSDEEIINSMSRLAKDSGFFAEPAAAAAFSGIEKAQQMKTFDKKDKILMLLTGSGLKDIENATKTTKEPIDIAPKPDSLDIINAH